MAMPERAGAVAVPRGLLVSRGIEQAALGVGSLVLARVLGRSAFAPLSALLVINSLSTTLSDFGLGLAIFRLAPRQRIQSAIAVRARWVNLGVAIALGASGAAVGGVDGLVIGAAGTVWATSAEAYIRKASAHQSHAVKHIVAAEIAGAMAFAAAVVGAAANPASAVVWTAAGLVAKHAAEVLALRSISIPLSTDGARPPLWNLWVAQALSYATANVDYLVAGLLLGGPAFSAYVIAFRVASAVPAQVANVAGRLSIVDFARAEGPNFAAVYDRHLRRMAFVGGAGAVTTLAVAPLLPVALGSDWRSAGWAAAVLALALPGRMCLTVASSALLVLDEATLSRRLESIRLLVAALTLGGAAAVGGFSPFVAVAAVGPILASLLYHHFAVRHHQISTPAWLPATVMSALVLVVVIAAASASV